MSRPPPRYESGDNVQATDADGRVYDGVVRYRYTAPCGCYAYAIETADADGVIHFPEDRLRKQPDPPNHKPGARHHRRR